MQRSHPRFVTTQDIVTDPETGKIYGREQPIPYKVAARIGIVPVIDDEAGETERSGQPGPNTAQDSSANRMRRQGGNR